MITEAITVSRLATCQRCPRLLAYDLHKRATNAWLVGIKGNGVYYGSLFHNSIARPFFIAASDPNSSMRRAIALALTEGQKGLDVLAHSLLEVIERYIFNPFINAHAAEYSAEQLIALAHGTENWVQSMAEFLSGIPSLCADPITNMSRVFFEPETKIKANYESERGTLIVTGQFDALLLDPDKGEAVIFEFKGHSRSDITVPLSQALTYAWLVKQETGILPGVQVIYLDNDQEYCVDQGQACDIKRALQERSLKLNSSEVGAALAGLPYLFETALDVITYPVTHAPKPLPKSVSPELCRECPFVDSCDDDWDNAGFNFNFDFKVRNAEKTVSPQVFSLQNSQEAQELMTRLLSTLSGLGLSVEAVGHDVGPAFVRLKVKPVLGKTHVNKLLKLADDLQVQMALSASPRIEVIGGSVAVDIPRRQRQTITLDELLAIEQHVSSQDFNRRVPSHSGDAAFPLGVTVDSRVRWVNLAEPNTSHVLIGGMTGSGKSVLLKSIVAGLLLAHAPAPDPCPCFFTLVDPKMVTFSEFEGLKALDGGHVIYDLSGALEALSCGVAEMEQRYEVMKAYGAESLNDLNALNSYQPRLKRKIFIIDEYADLMMDKGTTQELQSLIQRIAQKGRAAGLHLILATQRPDAKVVTGLIKSNLPLHIALKVVNRSNSGIILDESGAEKLLGHGDMLAPSQSGHGGLERLQGAYVANVKDLLGAKYFY